MASMISISQAWDATNAIFNFVTSKYSSEGHPMSNLCMTLKWPAKVNQGQKSRCTFVNWAMVNISVYRHHGPGTTDRTIRPIFTFVTLTIEMASWRSFKVNFCGFWKSGIDFLLVFHSNLMLISHHQEDICDFHIRDPYMSPKGQSRSKVNVHFY